MPRDPEGESNHPDLIGHPAVLDVVLFRVGEVPDRRLVDGDVGRERDAASDLMASSIRLVTADKFLVPGLALGTTVLSEVMIATVQGDPGLAGCVFLIGGCGMRPRYREPSDDGSMHGPTVILPSSFVPMYRAAFLAGKP